MKLKATLGAALAVAGCASPGGPSLAPDRILGGESGDLRVMFDDDCPQAYPEADFPTRGDDPTKGLDDLAAAPALALNILSNIGGIAFQSFGTYLKHTGQEDFTRSVGANGGLFYTSPSQGDVGINPDLRCMYLVRNGFAPHAPNYTGNAPDDLKQTWARLGLTQTPDLFAHLYVQTSGDIGGGAMISGGEADTDSDTPAFWNPAVSPPYFRLKLDRLYIKDFQSASAAPTRDLALIFNYGLAASRTVVIAEGASAGAPELAAKFAVGGVRLSGAQPGDYKGASLTALQSAWMPVPGVKSYDPRATVDVIAYVVEFSPGNPMLEEIGEYLAGQDVRRQVENTINETVVGED